MDGGGQSESSGTVSWMRRFMHGTGVLPPKFPQQPYVLPIGGVLCLCATDGRCFVAVPARARDLASGVDRENKATPPPAIITSAAIKREVRLDVLREWCEPPEVAMLAFDEQGCGPCTMLPDREGEIGGIRIDRNRLAHLLQAFEGETATLWVQGPLSPIMLANDSAVAVIMPRTGVIFEQQEEAIAEKLARRS